jgi:hypothetical protein
MTRTAFAVALAAALLATSGASAFDRDHDRGWGAYYNNHLSSWDGRPVGPPLPALPRGYQYYNNRLMVGAGPSPWGDPYPTYVPPTYAGQPYVTGSVRTVRKRKTGRRP